MRVFVLPVCHVYLVVLRPNRDHGLVVFDSRLSSQSNQSKRDGHELLLQIFVHVRFILVYVMCTAGARTTLLPPQNKLAQARPHPYMLLTVCISACAST